MSEFNSTQMRSINNYFLRIFIPIVLFVSTVISMLLAWNDYQTNKTSRLASQKLIFSTFIATIKQPLIQGSLIEAQIRANELVQYGQIACIEIKISSDTIKSCKKVVDKFNGYFVMESDIYFSENTNNKMGHLAITFDNSDLVAGIWKNAGKNVVGFLLLALILFAALTIGFSRIRLELNELMKIAGAKTNDKSEIPDFRISEFSSLGKNLVHQFEVSKAEVEAKAALDVARQVAHDIRSPVLSLQIALNAAQSQLDLKFKNVLNHSAQRISDIADDVISQYSPINHNYEVHVPIKKLPMSVNLALSEMISEKILMCSRFPNLTFKMHEIDEDTFIEMRVSDFKRIISNLIDNAVQAITEQGIIEIGCKQYNNECLISITDNGIGISVDTLKSILEKGGSYGKAKGKGLGFQWAKKTVEDHGGRLLLESELGLGTTVKIQLPILMDQDVRSQTGVHLSLSS